MLSSINYKYHLYQDLGLSRIRGLFNSSSQVLYFMFIVTQAWKSKCLKGKHYYIIKYAIILKSGSDCLFWIVAYFNMSLRKGKDIKATVRTWFKKIDRLSRSIIFSTSVSIYCTIKLLWTWSLSSQTILYLGMMMKTNSYYASPIYQGLD